MAESEADQIAARVREELARRRLSRQALADMAKISISTLEKALAGRRAFTLATIVRLEQALDISLRSKSGAAEPPIKETDCNALGSYSRAAVRWLEGRYLTLRPSFGPKGHIYAYVTQIDWQGDRSHLVFAETDRLDRSFSQRGDVSVSHMSGHIYLVTNVEGQYRLAILSRPTIEGAIYGILTTLMVGHGSQLTPVSAPIALLPLSPTDDAALGRIAPEHAAFGQYRAELDTVMAQEYARFPQ